MSFGFRGVDSELEELAPLWCITAWPCMFVESWPTHLDEQSIGGVAPGLRLTQHLLCRLLLAHGGPQERKNGVEGV